MNPYILTIHKRVTTRYLSLPRLSPESEERLEYIWRLHEEGKSNTYIRDRMNIRYGTTLRTTKPYYTTLIYEMIKKYRRRLERMKDYEEEYLKVEFIKVENWNSKNYLNYYDK